jgi:hypothetical protein
VPRGFESYYGCDVEVIVDMRRRTARACQVDGLRENLLVPNRSRWSKTMAIK